MRMRPIILDTDIGTDIDDAIALAQAVRAPALDLRAVTTVYGDVHLRARLARKLLDLLGRPGVPVAAGLGQPLTPDRVPYWGGWEGEGLLTADDHALPLDPRDGVTLILDELATAQEPLTLVAIGPLTNIAAVIQQGGSILSHIDEIICMAGTIVPGEEEWNVLCDADAACIVFQSGLPVTLGTRFIVNEPKLKRTDRDRLAHSEDPGIQAVVALLDHFLAIKQRDQRQMCDPVALSMAYSDEFIQAETMTLSVRQQGDIITLTPEPRGKHSINISVSVRPEAFIDHLVGLLLAG
jgi:purine nucleosidase